LTPERPIAELLAEAALASPPALAAERQNDLVALATLDPTLRIDLRYATDDNFVGAAVYPPTARAWLQRPAAEALLRAHRALAALGLGLWIFDAYRPWSVTKVFWDATPPRLREFVADPAQGSRHNRGCAVDLTLYELRTGKPVSMPSAFDEFTPRAYPRYPGGNSQQRWHRDLLRQVMETAGFTVNSSEWWHFDHADWQRYPVGNTTL
jgi:D-alanyl-D-alanine dipeptidase